jgi:hypothetical protein
MAGAAGAQSCVADLLVLYKALLNAEVDQSTHNRAFTEGLPFRHVPALFSPHIALPDSDINKQVYGLG